MKRTLYVVDDQAPLLEVAMLILRMMDRQWEVVGFTDPREALEAVKARAPYLILSDLVMPGMQGSELLEAVRALSPTTIRIIMSGHVPLNRLTLITSAHQYLAKPFDASTLSGMVKRSLAAEERIVNQGLRTVVSGLRSIPSLPQAHQSLLHELEQRRTGIKTIAGRVEEDPGLSLKVLHLANSSLFGADCVVTSPEEAVMRLGTQMVAAIVLSQSLFRHYESLKRPEMDLQRVWTHSWETARLAQHICRDQGLAAKRGEEAFLAGLIHEIGRFILIDNYPDQFRAACEAARHNSSPLAARLREAFQASPAQVGAYVLECGGCRRRSSAPLRRWTIRQRTRPTASPSARRSMSPTTSPRKNSRRIRFPSRSGNRVISSPLAVRTRSRHGRSSFRRRRAKGREIEECLKRTPPGP